MPEKQKPTEWVNVSNHAVPLASGQVLAPGEKDECDMKDPFDKAHRDEGLLVRAQTEEKS